MLEFVCLGMSGVALLKSGMKSKRVSARLPSSWPARRRAAGRRAVAAGLPALRNLPAVLPKRWFDRIKPRYPYMVAGAFLLPAMHQSSLGSLVVIAGTKVRPLWQMQMLPAFCLMQAIVCGFASLIIILQRRARLPLQPHYAGLPVRPIVDLFPKYRRAAHVRRLHRNGYRAVHRRRPPFRYSSRPHC